MATRLGEKIKALRKQRGMTLDVLALKADIALVFVVIRRGAVGGRHHRRALFAQLMLVELRRHPVFARIAKVPAFHLARSKFAFAFRACEVTMAMRRRDLVLRHDRLLLIGIRRRIVSGLGAIRCSSSGTLCVG